MYLGVTFSSSSVGFKAVKAAIVKARQAITPVIAILAKSKSDSWATKLKLFDAIISPTLLYGAHLWGLRYLDMLECIQTNFFKRLFHLPCNTPGYAIRVELGLLPTQFKIFKQAWSWIVRMLEMPDHRLPRKCFLRLHELSNLPNTDSRFNWATQFLGILVEIGHADIWQNLDPSAWKTAKKWFSKTWLTISGEEILRDIKPHHSASYFWNPWIFYSRQPTSASAVQ